MATGGVSQMIARECIAMRVRLLNRVVTKIYDDCLRPYGLRAAQQNILVAVSLMKLATPSKLERRLSLDKSTVSRNVERMRRRGWVEFVSGEDGRSHHLHVTAEGMKLLRQLYDKVSEDVREDGLHPSDKGTAKIAEMMLKFFTSDPTAKVWFLK